jgi:hypothetical protein
MLRFNPVNWVAGYAATIRYPFLLLVTAIAFVVDLFVPDLLPFADELLLALLTALFASLRRRRTDRDTAAAADAND